MVLARAGRGGMAADEPWLPWAAVALASYAVVLFGSALLLRRRDRP